MNNRILSLVSTTSLLSLTVGAADLPDTDKSAYSILNRTPSAALRPFQSDEADKVVSPFTVDAGHFQIEGDFVNYYGYDAKSAGFGGGYNESEDMFTWAPRVKVGLCNNVDLEVQSSYTTDTQRSRFSEVSPDGYVFESNYKHISADFGPAIPKFKINLWGNDGGMTALAVAPYLTIPTDGHGEIMGGAEIPFAVRLRQDVTLKLATDFHWFEESGIHMDSGYYAYYKTLRMGFGNSASLIKSFTPSFNVFGDVSTLVTTDSEQSWMGYAGFGASYTFVSSFQVYAGMRFGIGSAYFDNNPYLGAAWRF